MRPSHHRPFTCAHASAFIRARIVATFVVTTLAWPAARASAQAGAAPDPALARAESLFARKQYADAATAYQAIARQRPNIARPWGRLGTSLHLLGKYDQAIEAYGYAIAIAPASSYLMYNLAAAHARQHHADSAFVWLRKSAQYGFANAQTLVGDSDFVSLHADARYDSVLVALREALRPCMHRQQSRQFDFWVGEWDVQNAQGQPAGRSSVKLLMEGCALYENWVDGQGGEGKSLNSYNPDLDMWQQFWTDQYGRVTEYRSSRWVGPSLEYTARQKLPAGPALLHMTFTPMGPDLVRQHGQSSFDDGKTWTEAYDLYYHRKKP